MDRSGRHIIYKISANVNCTVDSFQEVNNCNISDAIKSAIDDLNIEFEELSGHQTLSIETISIDVDLSSNRLYQLKDKIKSALKEQILESRLENENHENSILAKQANGLSTIEILVHFLRTGNLPWTVKKLSLNLEEFTEDNVQEDFIIPLLIELDKNNCSIVRLVNQFSEDKVLELVALLVDSQFSEEVKILISHLKSTSKKYSKIYDIDYRLSIFLLEALISSIVKSKSSPSSYQQIWNLAIETSLKEALSKYPDLNMIIFEEAILESNINKLMPSLDLVTDLNINKRDPNINIEALNSEAESKKAFEETKYSEKLKNSLESLEIDDKENSNLKQSKITNIAEESVQVFNAGIILLHPFLSKFFAKVGLIENGQFITIACRQRAVCLLHYIATGEVEFEEQKLHFQKFICNYQGEESIPRDLPISQFEKDEADKLLNAVLSHWKTLKGVSIQGLRGNFLSRNGVLQYDGDEIIIHVENKTADILLKQLPWTLSFAKWSWHPNLLTIKWS